MAVSKVQYEQALATIKEHGEHIHSVASGKGLKDTGNNGGGAVLPRHVLFERAIDIKNQYEKENPKIEGKKK
jgi:hypothetical protein